MENKASFKQTITAGLMASVSASIINAILFFLFKQLGVFVDTIFIQPDQPLTVVPIIISSTAPTLIGSIVYFLLDKYTQNGFKIFSIVSVVLVVLSFANPFMGIKDVTVPYAMALNAMHVVVAGALLYFINKSRNK